MDTAAPPAMSQRALATVARYRGERARGYEAKRVTQEKWAAEHTIMSTWLNALPAGATVLDIPFGTGRFVPIYHARQFHVRGRDINRDMLDQAKRKKLDPTWDIGLGNILAIDLADASVDVAVCVRLLNFLEPAELRRALGELQRVARKWVIASVRVGGRHGGLTRPQSMADVVAALRPG